MELLAIWKELNEALTHTLADPIVSRAEVASHNALTKKCPGERSEGYALALAITRLHEARESSLQPDPLNARLLAWYDAATTSVDLPPSAAQRGDAWGLVLAEGLALTALHSESAFGLRDVLCKALIAALAEAISPDLEVQRLRLRGLITALAYSQVSGNLPARLELDAIAAQCISSLPNGAIEKGRW